MTATTEPQAHHIDIQLEIRIEAPRDRVWTALTDEIGAWWHKDFFTHPDAGSFRLQPKLGGWMYEDWGDGDGQLWGTVNGVRKGEMLQVVGDTSADWGGPNRGILTWRLEEEAGVTVVAFRHSLFGNVSEQTRDSLEGGWRLLFEDCMKAYVEGGARPEASDADAPPCDA